MSFCSPITGNWREAFSYAAPKRLGSIDFIPEDSPKIGGWEVHTEDWQLLAGSLPARSVPKPNFQSISPRPHKEVVVFGITRNSQRLDGGDAAENEGDLGLGQRRRAG